MAYEPSPRYYHFSAGVERQFYTYGGYHTGEPPTTVHIFSCDYENWRQATTTEGTHPPPNLCSGVCTSVEHCVYLQGGWDKRQYYNTLYQLDCRDLKWTQLSSAGDQGAPIAKYCHGMVHHGPSECLLVFGGYGPRPTGPTQPGAEYKGGDRVYTNELHIFNLREGQWSSPAVTGRRPPPCRDFILTMVDDHRAVLFGGCDHIGLPLKHLYVLDIARMHCGQVDDDKGGPWPEERLDHAAVCLGFGGDHPQLLITGGQDDGLETLGDAWTLDLRSWRWREVKGHSLKRREGHSTTAFTLSQEVTEVIMFGGLDDFNELADTTLLRFEWLEQDGPPTKEWVLTDTATGSQLGMEQRVRKKEEIITSAGITEIAAAIEKDENIDRKHAQAMFIGPGGSGKSSLMERLIYRVRHQFYPSTGVADPVVIVDVGTNPSIFYAVSVLDSHTWEEVKFDKSLISQMHESVHSIRQQQAQAKMAEGTINASSKSIASPAPTSASESNTMSGANRTAVPVASPASPSPVNPDIRQVISSAVIRHGGYSQFYNLLKKKFSLYLRDAGGQVEFQEMVSLLVLGPSIFLFVFRADQDLKSTFIVGYRMSTNETINSYTSSISTEEALLQCLASVYAMETPDKASFSTHNPYVLIVATHKDKLGPSADQKILQLDNSLKALIKESGFESLVLYADAAKGQVVFPVDNTSESDDDFIPIRSKIHTLITSREEFTIKYPMSYLLFCLELQSDQRSVLTLEECKAMAAKYKIVGDQVFELLYFLHLRIGVVHFIDIEGVKCIVMKRPEDLFSTVTDLVVKTFSCGALTVEETDDYQRKGILTASAFESVISRQDAITGSEFLKILVHLRIIAEFTKDGEKEKRYFIPCVLNHVSESTGRELETDIASLAVKFKCKHCPKGLFGVLVTHLLTPEAGEREGSSITFALRDNKIFKDQVFFAVQCSGDFDTISLKAYSTHLEIKFFPGSLEDRDEPVSFACEEVRKAIAESINKSLVDLHYSREKLKPSVCLRCTQKSCSELHPVSKGKSFHKIHCDETGQTSRLPAQGRCWYNEGEPSPGVGSTGSVTEASGHSHQTEMDQGHRATGGVSSHPPQSGHSGAGASGGVTSHPPQSGHSGAGASGGVTSHPPQSGHSGAGASGGVTSHPPQSGHSGAGASGGVTSHPPQSGHSGAGASGGVTSHPPQSGHSGAGTSGGVTSHPPQSGHSGAGASGGVTSYLPHIGPRGGQPFALLYYAAAQPFAHPAGQFLQPWQPTPSVCPTGQPWPSAVPQLSLPPHQVPGYHPFCTTPYGRLPSAPLPQDTFWTHSSVGAVQGNSSDTGAANSEFSYSNGDAEALSRILSFEDQAKVVNYFRYLSNQEITNIGVRLGLSYARFTRMSSESLMNDMVLAWLRKDDDVGEISGDPSWQTLCTALKECGHTGIALTIQRKEARR